MKLAFIFPGQGSQSVGMLSDLADKFSIVNEIFAQAKDTLGYDLWHLIQTGPAQKLAQTEITQAAMLTSGFATYQVCQKELNIAPSVMAGHSLGEYTALVAAEALTFDDALNLVATRGRLMQQAVELGAGAMAAILGLADEVVQEVCATTDGVVEAVNFNSPGQIVIAGEKQAVENACKLAKEKGAKRALVLPVSVPSHSSLMKPAADKFSQYLNEVLINPPHIPVINNVDAKAEIEPDMIRSALIRQLYNPVLWVDIINNMASQNIDTIIESGPGKVLFGLNRRINKNIANYTVFDSASLESLQNSLKG